MKTTIRSLYEVHGMTISAIARELKLSEKFVRDVVRGII